MSESFVDLSYRGLSLGKRIKLTQVRPSTGFLEMPMPMPVGTTIGIATDEGLSLEATVAEVREHVTGAGDRLPGMVVRPKFDLDTVHGWWAQRVTLPELETPVPQADAGGKVTLVGRRADATLVDDGRSTAVMTTIDDEHVQPTRTTNPGFGALAADQQGIKRDTDPAIELPIVDDGKRTMAMSAVELEALGLDPASSSGSMRAFRDSGPVPVIGGDEDPDASSPDDASPDAGGRTTKKKRRRR